MKEFDVIIIGAGPAGSIAASNLVDEGWQVMLVDKNKSPGINKPCGGLLSRQALKDFNISGDLIQKEIKKETYFFPWGSKEKDVSNITVLRREFDRYLALRAMEKGVLFLAETKAIDVKIEYPGKVIVKIIRKKEKEPEQINSKIVIFADGVRSQAQKCNIGFKKTNKNSAFAIFYEIEAKDNKIKHCEIYFDNKIYSWGYAWMFPKRNLLNVGVGCITTELNRKKDIKAKLDSFIKDRLTHLKINESPILRKKGGYIPLYLAKNATNDSSIAIGDAGGYVHSLFCAGIDTAMYSALAAAEIVNECLTYNKYDMRYLNKVRLILKKQNYYGFIKKQNMITTIFQPITNIDQDIFPRLINIMIFGENVTYYKKILSLLSTKYLENNLY